MRRQELLDSTVMEAVHGTVDVDIPADVLWECFSQPRLWPRWNTCMYAALNKRLKLGKQLIWAFDPIKWWYGYKLGGIAKIVELEPMKKVTWEVSALPGFYALHTYTVEDLGDGRSRFGSWEQAMGPTARMLKFFWVAHFKFVKDRSLQGASHLEQIYKRHGRIDATTLPRRPYVPLSAAFKSLRRTRSLVQMEYEQLADGVYAALNGGGNSLIVSDGGETLLVDTKLPPFDKRMKAWIAKTTNAPVTKIVNTHFHYDHTQGNKLYPDAHIIAHPDAQRLMEKRDRRLWRKDKDGLPDETVADSLTVEIGSQKVTIHNGGQGHTASDLWVELERDGKHIIVTGDVASLVVHPFFDPGEGGADLRNMVASLRRWSADYPDAIFVPGHGNVATSADLLEHADYLEFLLEHVGRAKAMGLSKRQAVSNIGLARFNLANLPIFHYGTTFLSARSNIKQSYDYLERSR